MVTKQFKFGIMPKGIGIGLASSITSTILGAAIAAWLIETEKIGEGAAGYITIILLLLSSILGAIVSLRIIGQNRLPVCLLTGVAYFITLLSINALFYRGMYSGVGESGLLILAGVISVALFGANKRNKTKRKRIK